MFSPTNTFAYTFNFQNEGELSHDRNVTAKLPNLIIQVIIYYYDYYLLI